MSTPHWYPTGTLEEPFLPRPVDDALLAFPARIEHLLPPQEKIPDHFKGIYDWPNNEPTDKSAESFREFQETWFYKGLSEDAAFHLRDGIDGDTAVRHLRAIQGSFAPKHEYKIAAIAYLASLWFKKIEYNGKVAK